jgi:hypothetical protein
MSKQIKSEFLLTQNDFAPQILKHFFLIHTTNQENKKAIRPLIRQNMKKIDYFFILKICLD